MPDGKANYGFFGGGSVSALEQLITGRDHETAHDVPILGVLARSVGRCRLVQWDHGGFETPNVSILLKEKKNLLRTAKFCNRRIKYWYGLFFWEVYRNSHGGMWCCSSGVHHGLQTVMKCARVVSCP